MDYMNTSEIDYSHYNNDYMNTREIDYSYYDNVSWDESMVGTYPPPSLKAHQVVAMVIYMVVFIVGIPGNMLVLWVTISKVQHTINAIWFLNLAVADLLSCLALPIIIVTILMHGNWPLSGMACQILTSLILLNLYASILLLVTISADRLLIVFQPIWCQNYRVAWLAWLASGVAWILALVLSIPSFMFRRLHKDPFSKTTKCIMDYGWDGRQVELTVTVMRLVLSFLGPLIMLSTCYTFLLLRTWRRPATRSTKTLKVVVAMVTTFFIFWLPYHVSGMVLVLLPRDSSTYKYAMSLHILWVALAYVNCCINPIIYMVATQDLHTRVLKSLPAKLHQLLAEDSDTENKSYSLTKMDSEVHKSQV